VQDAWFGNTHYQTWLQSNTIANTPGFGSADVASWGKFAVRTLLSKILLIGINSYPALALLSPRSAYGGLLKPCKVGWVI